MRRVVVTGLGVVAPTGNTVVDAWRAALSGRSFVGNITQFDASQLPVQLAAEVRGFDPATVMSAKEARQSSRFVQFAAGAASQAVADAQLDVSQIAERCGTMIGVGIGCMGKIEEGAISLRDRGPERVSPLLMPYAIPNMAAGFVSILQGLRGPNLCIATACASGSHAIGEAFMHLKAGTADVMIAGGTESTVTPLCVSAFARMNALSTKNDSPQSASRPFDANRDGFVIGEGCGLIVLEEFEHASKRGARIYAELVGYGLSADAYHIATPSREGEGLARAIAGALRSASINCDQVDYINAHGTSTQANDLLESAAIETVFGHHARQVSISSTKGATGHCLGAAGGIEAVYTVLAMHHGIIPPTANLDAADPQCRLDYTPIKPRERRVRYALSNSSGFGGHNACLAFKNFESAADRRSSEVRAGRF
jgi:3-oxoacyl-[acyl-carrier-protein] synthase II